MDGQTPGGVTINGIRFHQGTDMGAFDLSREARAPIALYAESPDLNDKLAFYTRLSKKYTEMSLDPAPSHYFKLEGAYVNRAGQIWDDGGILFDGSRPFRQDIGEARAAVDNGTARVLDRACVLAMPAVGYYHWMMEGLASLAWLIAARERDVAIAVPEDSSAYKRHSLTLAGLEAEVVMFEEPFVYCRELFIGPPIFYGIREWQAVAPFYLRIRTGARRLSRLRGERVYISRRDAGRRTMTNEAELEEQLQARGFTVALLSTMPLADQIALLSSASVIVSPHGAGLSNIVFADPGAHVVEIIPYDPAEKPHRFAFMKIACLRGLRYTNHMVAAADKGKVWSLDIDRFLRRLDAAL